MLNMKDFEPRYTDEWKIVHDYHDLHYDQGPVLFTGINKNNKRILASTIDEDFKKKLQQFFYTIISDLMYSDFLHFKLTYRDVMERGQKLYFINMSFDETTMEVAHIKFSDIPEDHLPTNESFAPDFSRLYEINK